jgi:hypothetical protein
MDINDAEVRDYLIELYNQTEGNQEKQVSMHDVGSALGMDKNQAGALGQDLVVEGLVDLRTLAGGISITSQGLEMLQVGGYITVSVKDSFQLSGGPVINEIDRQAIEKMIEKIKQAVTQKIAQFQDLEEIIIDLKTLEVHLLSPKPKTSIVRAILSSLHLSLEKLELHEITLVLSGAF